MLPTYFAAALTLAIVVAVVSGCGGSSKTVATTSAVSTTTPTTISTTTPTTSSGGEHPGSAVAEVRPASGTPLTRSAWLATGDAICARLNAQLTADTVKSAHEFAEVLPQTAADERAEFKQLVKLVPPTSMAKDWQEFLTYTHEWSENSAKLGNLALAGHLSLSAPLAITTREVHEHLAQIAKRDGFKECSLV